MRRVVITGIGIVSSIGNDVDEVTQSLINGASGIISAPDYAELGFRSQVKGAVKLDVSEHIDRKKMRFMGDGSAYAVLSMEQAILDSGLEETDVSNPRTGLIAGSGGPSTANVVIAADITREKGPKRRENGPEPSNGGQQPRAKKSFVSRDFSQPAGNGETVATIGCWRREWVCKQNLSP